jgi:hypothetical protein
VLLPMLLLLVQKTLLLWARRGAARRGSPRAITTSF